MKSHRQTLSSFGLAALVAGGFYAPAFGQSSGALEADSVTIDEQSGEIEATGNVEIVGNGNLLRTQKLRLNNTTKTLNIVSPMTLRQDDGLTLKAKTATLNSALDTGTLKNVQLVLPENAGRMGAAEVAHSPDILVLRNAIFTACDECEDPNDAPLWQIQAGKINYDRVGQNVVYAHPRLEVYGVPVFYLPYMAHAGPEVERRSGFLAPRIASSGDFGAAVETPYFINLADNYDLTVSPRISEFQNPFMTGEWRHLTRFGSYEMTAYAHQPSGDLSDDTDRDTRLALTGSGDFNLADWQLSFAVQDASDDLFFKRYKLSETNRLESRLSLRREWDNQSLNIEAYRFRNTLRAESAATVDMILPRLTHEVYFDRLILGGELSMINRLTHDQRALGTDVTHAASLLDWRWQHTTRGGFVLSANNRLSLDAYQYDPLEGQTVEAEEFLSANATAFTVAYPLERRGKNDTQTLTPQAQLVLATENEDYEAVPFISGTSISLSRAQLFNPLTTKDEASRFNFGVTHKLDFMSRLQTEFFLGQSLNLSDRSFSAATGYGDDRSALLADIALTAGPLSLSRQTRFDSTGSEELRSETAAGLSFSRLQIGLTHSFYEAGQQGGEILEEATGRVNWRIGKNWSLEASTRENLEADLSVETMAGLTYEDECTLLTLSLERDYSRIEQANIEPDTSINFAFTLKTIGSTPAR